jgi:choline dehydrogenase-like flavoprotein
MIVDCSILTREGIAFDLVIVGAGAAGLTLAQAAGAKGLHVLLLEAGGARETNAGRAALAGELATPNGHPALDLYRVRALGGTSRLWGGRCIPLDPIDFVTRDWIPNSGWPIRYSQLAAYYPPAMKVAEAGENTFDPSMMLSNSQAELAPGLDGELIRTTIERFSRPTDFWKRFGDELTASPRVHVLPETRLAEIKLDPDATTVRGVVLIDKAGRRICARASNYVLALGGLETTRILLTSRDVKPAGIGNDFDQLGRYYMSHLCSNGGIADFSPSARSLAYDYDRDKDGVYLRRRLWLTEKAQRTFRLANMTFRTNVPDPGDPVHGNAILSAMFLSKSMVQKEYAAKLGENPIKAFDYIRHVKNVLGNPGELARFASVWVRRRILADRKLPSVVLPSADHRYPLEFHVEQMPNPASRVSLSTSLDPDGMPRLKVDWKVLDADVEGIINAHKLLGREISRTRTGTFRFDAEELASRIREKSIVGGHHIGTTRMSSSPKHGVVDPDCRVHGVDNLFVASSAVMPTSGQANPTLTIIALSLRLADHLAKRKSSAATTAVHIPIRRAIA